MKILNIENLKFDQVILMYLPYMWNNDLNYQKTLIEANHHFKTSPCEGKENQKDPKYNKYKYDSHGYFVHGGAKSKGNVVMYHHNNILDCEQIFLKNLVIILLSLFGNIWINLVFKYKKILMINLLL